MSLCTIYPEASFVRSFQLQTLLVSTILCKRNLISDKVRWKKLLKRFQNVKHSCNNVLSSLGGVANFTFGLISFLLCIVLVRPASTMLQF